MSKLASKDSSRDIAESDADKDSTKIASDGKPKETPQILKYIKTQVPISSQLGTDSFISDEYFFRSKMLFTVH